MEINIIYCLTALIMISGCAERYAGFATVSFDDVVYVDEFPKYHTLQVSDGCDVELQVLGMYDVRLVDSLLLITDTRGSDGYVSVFNIDNLQNLGSFFKYGNGPNEALNPVLVRNMAVSDEESAFFCTAGKIFEWDMMKSIESGYSVLSLLDDADSDPFILNGLYINDSTVFHVGLSHHEDRQQRILVVNGERIPVDVMEKLNETVIKTKGDPYLFNILTFNIRHASEHNLMVEAATMMNTINVYSLDGKTAKTICIGSSLDNVYEIETRKLRNLPFTFSDLRVYDDFFAALYQGTTLGEQELKLHPNPRIMIFDYSCNPLAEIQLPHDATAFDINIEDKTLFVLDGNTETLMKYDISDCFN